jgi:MFS family permease
MSTRERVVTLPFVLAGAANFLSGLALHGYVHLPGFLEDLGADDSDVGLVFGSMSGAAIAIRPIAGRWMDMRGRRVVILAGCALHTIACALYLTVSSIGPWLFAVRLMQGAAQGAIFSALFTYAADIVPASRRTEGIALFGTSGLLPIACGPLLGDFVLAHGSYRDFFAISTAISIASLLAALPLRDAERARGEAGAGFFAALRQKDLVPIWVVGSAFAMAIASAFGFIKLFVEREPHVGSDGLYFSAYAIAAIALRVLFGWVPQRVGPKRALYPAILCIAGSLVALALARDPIALAASGALAGLGHGFAFPILSALTVTRADPRDRGSAVALFTAIFDAGILLGGLILGPIAEATDLRTMFWMAAAIPVAGMITFMIWDRGHASGN